MKKILTLILSFFLFIQPCHGQEFVDEFEEDEQEELGMCAKKSYSDGVGFSMMGWGIAIIVTISILAVVLNQSIQHVQHSSSSSHP